MSRIGQQGLRKGPEQHSSATVWGYLSMGCVLSRSLTASDSSVPVSTLSFQQEGIGEDHMA